MVDHRLKLIFEEASKLFITKGYARTQISYIANASGISVGAVYTLFESKKAILDFILTIITNPDYINEEFELPVKESYFYNLQDDVFNLFNKSNKDFEKHFNIDKTGYHFNQMLSDIFDMFSQYGIGFLILQNNSSDCGIMFEKYVDYRKKFCQNVEQYVGQFIEQGEVRTLTSLKNHARLIIETLSWWGMHVRYDAFETNPTLTQDEAKKVALDALAHAYQKS